VVSDDNPIGCTNINSISQVVRVSPEIDFTGTQATNSTLCFGETTTIDGMATIPQFEDCAPEIFDQTWLEDTQSTGNAASYTSTITVDCYGPGQVITDVSQITDICVVIEHSFIGDLDIYLIAPNGAEVWFLEYGDGNDPGAYFGIPDQADNGNPGTGWEYCFSPTATQSINDVATGGTSVPIGTYAPLPTSSFDNLIGSPLNGNWTFVVSDLWAIDDGTLFSWNLNFDPSLVPPSNVIVSEAWDTDSTITNTTGNTITVAPPTAGQHCYTYRAMDDFGCEYTEQVCIDMLPEIINDIPSNFYMCNPGAPPYIFDLTDNDPILLAPSPNPGDLVISYYENLNDAQNETSPISAPNTYSSTAVLGAPQTIYVRVEYLTSNCYEIESFTLNITTQPTINSVSDLEVCDDVTNDGFAVFDLEFQTAGILGTQPSSDFQVTYYTDLASATSGTGNIVSPYTNTVSPEPIYVRVESLTDATCFSVSPVPVFDLVVLVSDDPGFTTTPTCDGGTVTITGTVGGTFSLNPDPGDGTTIDPVTGEVTGGTPENSYTIEYTTMGTCPQTSQETVTVLALDDSGFSMSPTCDGGTSTVSGLPGGTFSFSNPLPTDGAVIDPSTGTVSGGSPDTGYTVAYTTNGPCITTTVVTFTSHPLPTIVAPTPLEVCDDGVPDGITSIDLSIKNTEISGGNTSIQVTYYLTQLDADQEMNPLPIPYTNIVNNQIVYVRGEDVNTGCHTTTTLELVVEQAPVANTPPPLEFCDPDSDGFGEFDLESATPIITGGDPNLTVTYHETMSDAQNNVNAQTSPYNNIVAYNQPIYVRVESATIATACATFLDLQLTVFDTPDIADPPTPLELCDDDTDGFAQFDLTSKDGEILNGLDPLQYAVSYYETQANAEAPMNPIVGTGSYTNIVPDMQTIWVRVDDTVTGCNSITTLDLIVNELPVLVQPVPLELCDYDNPGDEVEAFALEDSIEEILNGQTGIAISFHETQVGADTDTAEIFSPYVNAIANTQTIYVRAENEITGCVSTITLDLRVEPLPSPATPTPLDVCDDDNDGFMVFDLDSKTTEILNGEPDVTISYHETMADASNGDNPLTSPYANIVEDSQTIYVRAESDLTGCYAIVELQLNVLPSPEVPLEIDDYVICDDDNNGFAQFDLTIMDATILGSQLPTEFILTYHTNALDAQTGANPIVEPTLSSYTNTSNPQTIYVHLESVSNGCVATGEFELVVSLPPVPVFPAPLEICDDDYYDDWDGIATFDLTVKDSEITGGNASWTVNYYETDADAQAGTGAIDPAEAYQNIVNPQTLYVEVIDGDTGCSAYTTLLIRVNPNPTPEVPEPIELCDDINTGDGEEVFDLTIRELDIINGETGVSATYYETLEGAESGTGAIPDPTAYTNTGTPQIIYVRIANDATGCYTIVELELIVHPLPEVVAVTDLVACEYNTDGVYEFDLESKTDEVLNGQSPTDFMVTYHETLADAQAGTGDLVSPYTNTDNPQQIFVNITNVNTGCDIATVSFNIVVEEGVVADAPATDYVICDNLGDNDGIAQFNLTDTPNGDGYDYNGDLYAEILANQVSGFTYTLSFYDNLTDAEAGVNQIPTTYENTSNPQVIYVRVDNDTTSCYDITMLTLGVDLLPIFDLEDSYILCVDSPGGVPTDVPAPILDTGLSAMDYGFEWTDSAGTVVGTGPSLEPWYADSYGVVVTNLATGCQNGDTTEILESSPPDVEATVVTLAFSDQHVIEVSATGSEHGVYEFSLDGGPWVSGEPNTGSYTFDENISYGEHTIEARDINGCGEGSDTVLIMDYPKYFTPNGDGVHETWNIIGISDQPNAKIYIFDRFGKLLKQLSPTGTGWNGTYNGMPLPSDDYWFSVEYVEPDGEQGTKKEFKAHFALKR
jgi:gliding motility-associated-like protein